MVMAMIPPRPRPRPRLATLLLRWCGREGGTCPQAKATGGWFGEAIRSSEDEEVTVGGGVRRTPLDSPALFSNGVQWQRGECLCGCIHAVIALWSGCICVPLLIYLVY